MRRLVLLSSLIIGSTALHAAPLTLQPIQNDMIISVVDDGGEKAKKPRKAEKNRKAKHPAILALREKYKAKRQAAKGDKAAMMAVKKEFKAEAKALRQELGLKKGKKGKKGKGKNKPLADKT